MTERETETDRRTETQRDSLNDVCALQRYRELGYSSTAVAPVLVKNKDISLKISTINQIYDVVKQLAAASRTVYLLLCEEQIIHHCVSTLVTSVTFLSHSTPTRLQRPFALP